jgi:hypothetical protein
MGLHLDYCAEFGLSKDDILKEEEKLGMSGAAIFPL